MSTVRRPARRDPSSEGASAKAHHTILSQSIQGGFLDGVKLEFVDGLNCIIGGRGTGKTTALEFLRYSLGLMPDARLSPARAKAVESQVHGNLSGGTIGLEVQTKHGVRYTATRSWKEPTQVFTERGEPAAISFDRDLIFKADVYSQNEIEEIATNPSYQLAMIDKFVDDGIRDLGAQDRKLIRDLAENAGELMRLEREIDELRETAAEVPSLAQTLTGLADTTSPDAEIINTAHAMRGLRDKEQKAIEALHGDLQRLGSEFGSLASTWIRRLDAHIDGEIDAGPNQDVFAPAATAIQELTRLLDRGARKLAEQAAQATEVVSAQQIVLEQRHAKQEADYRGLVTRTKEEAGRAAERARVQKRHALAKDAHKALATRKEELNRLELQRRQLIAALSGLRDQRFLSRKSIADRLSSALHPTIRVAVTQAGDKGEYRALLTEGLKGSNMKYAVIVDKIIQSLSPSEFAPLVHRNDTEQLADLTGISAEHAKRVIDLLQNTDAIYEIEVVDLDDVPRIELLDGQQYKDSAGLSTGQRCTTVLPILLLESERPLLIDQPEDNLDNKFIYEAVVKSLKDAKGRRQLIFVTHNPNIPVLGDAERIFVLESDGKRASLAAQGTVDQMKVQIETLLEGGRDAFMLRMQRYGH